MNSGVSAALIGREKSFINHHSPTRIYPPSGQVASKEGNIRSSRSFPLIGIPESGVALAGGGLRNSFLDRGVSLPDSKLIRKSTWVLSLVQSELGRLVQRSDTSVFVNKNVEKSNAFSERGFINFMSLICPGRGAFSDFESSKSGMVLLPRPLLAPSTFTFWSFSWIIFDVSSTQTCRKERFWERIEQGLDQKAFQHLKWGYWHHTFTKSEICAKFWQFLF